MPEHALVLQRRHEEARAMIARVNAVHAAPFNQYVAEATGLAMYGCGILAAAHVGGLRALERHGLRYDKITHLAGASSGSVVVAMIAIGYDAEGLSNTNLTPTPTLSPAPILSLIGNDAKGLTLTLTLTLTLSPAPILSLIGYDAKGLTLILTLTPILSLIGCNAKGLYDLIATLPFERLMRPELGSLLRCGQMMLGNLLGLFGLRDDTSRGAQGGHAPGL